PAGAREPDMIRRSTLAVILCLGIGSSVLSWASYRREFKGAMSLFRENIVFLYLHEGLLRVVWMTGTSPLRAEYILAGHSDIPAVKIWSSDGSDTIVLFGS